MQIRLTRAVKVLLIACVAIFLLQQFAGAFGLNIVALFGLIPVGFMNEHRVWQIVTYAFLHGDVMHLVLNMLMLVFIGSELEALWGTATFLRYYFFCLATSGLFYLLMQVFVWGGEGLHTPMVGASGAIYGLLMAYGLIFSERVLLFMMLFPMKAKHFIWVLAAVEFLTSISSGRNGLAAVAHLSGMGAGFGYLWVRASLKILQKRRESGSPWAPKVRKTKRSSHLKLVKSSKSDSSGSDSDDDAPNGPKTWH